MTKQLKTHDQHRHRRGPVKRFLLTTGPFFFLTAAFLMSAGVVEIVEQAPTGKPAATLAEERAEAAANAPVDESVPDSSAATRIPALPASLLDADDYRWAYGPAEIRSAGQSADDGIHNFGLVNPVGSKPALGFARSSPGYGARLADPQDFGLR